ncbi:MAG: tryptophan synthase subunit alpha [Desulfobacterales bacterium]|nr:MAG: tryptophan synthase subunit alpha [Desulfobacterales bacterium]
MLNAYLTSRLAEKEILLMTHIVLGYPSFEAGLEMIETMVEAGVDLMELQIPFSEPTADGPVIAHANRKALENGATVEDCLNFAYLAARTFDIPFLIMSYYNLPFKYGLKRFVALLSDYGLQGAIIPDIPPEEGWEYLAAMQRWNLAPILIYAPTTSLARMRYIASFAGGFIYCVARKGVTGEETNFSDELEAYLKKCRQGTSLPLALGFGIKGRSDIDFLRGKADIAVIGSQTIRVVEEEGIEAVGEFIRGLR